MGRWRDWLWLITTSCYSLALTFGANGSARPGGLRS